ELHLFFRNSANRTATLGAASATLGVKACMFYDASSCFRAADSSEDPFSSRQDESSEGVSHNFVVEGLLQGTRDLSITPRDNQGDVFSRKARSFITEEILEALRKADRKGRDVVVGLSNACCKWGCSKSEISSLC
uniref:Insulin n=1 Tax=Labrus bergylta TaxID=56723 RepID=A0A3Q3FHP1_9LABR